MGRKRVNNPELPRRVYLHHGTYVYRPKGSNRRIPLGKSLQEALTAYAGMLAKEIPPSPSHALTYFMDRYLTEVAAKKAPRTYRDNQTEMANLRAVFGHMKPDDVTPPMVKRYIVERGAPVRANREKALLSHLYTTMIELWGVTRQNPCRGVKRNREVSRERLPELAELELFKSYCPPKYKLYVDLKLLTGLRKGDILDIELAHLTEEGLLVEPNKSQRTDQHGERRGKMRLYRWSPRLKALVDEVKALPRSPKCLYLFASRTGLRYTEKGFDANWKKYMAKFKAEHPEVEHFTEHDIRATSGTEAHRRGKDAKQLLGHKSQSMTDDYLRSRRIEEVDPLE